MVILNQTITTEQQESFYDSIIQTNSLNKAYRLLEDDKEDSSKLVLKRVTEINPKDGLTYTDVFMRYFRNMKAKTHCLSSSVYHIVFLPRIKKVYCEISRGKNLKRFKIVLINKEEFYRLYQYYINKSEELESKYSKKEVV